VTVVGARRRVDVALPSMSPIGEYLGTLAELCGETAGRSGPAVWTLAPAAARPFPPEVSLADAGVVDGQVLYLRDVAGDVDPPLVVRGAEPAGRAGSAAGPGLAATAAGLAWTTAAAVAAAVAGPGSGGATTVLVATAAALLAVAGWGGTGSRGLPWPARIATALAAMPPLGVAGAGVAADSWGAGSAAVGAVAGATLAAALATATTPDAAVVAVGFQCLAATAVAVPLVAIGAGGRESAAVVALAALGVLAAPPSIAATAAASALRLRQVRPGSGTTELLRQVRRADAVLACGGSAALAVALPVLGRAGDPYAVALAACAGLALLARAAGAAAGPRAVLLGAALLVVAFDAALALAARFPGSWWTLAVLVAPGLGLAGAGVVRPRARRRRLGAGWRRLLAAVWAVCWPLNLVLALGVLGFLT